MARIKEKTYVKCRRIGKIYEKNGQFYKYIAVNVKGLPTKVLFECQKDGQLTALSLMRLRKFNENGELL